MVLASNLHSLARAGREDGVLYACNRLYSALASLEHHPSYEEERRAECRIDTNLNWLALASTEPEQLPPSHAQYVNHLISIPTNKTSVRAQADARCFATSI